MNVEYEINKLIDEISAINRRFEAYDETIANLKVPVISGKEGEYLYIESNNFSSSKSILSEAVILNTADELNAIVDIVKGTIIVLNEDLGFKYREYTDANGKLTYTYDKYKLSNYPEMYNKFYLNTINGEIWFIGKTNRYLISKISKVITVNS